MLQVCTATGGDPVVGKNKWQMISQLIQKVEQDNSLVHIDHTTDMDSRYNHIKKITNTINNFNNNNNNLNNLNNNGDVGQISEELKELKEAMAKKDAELTGMEKFGNFVFINCSRSSKF